MSKFQERTVPLNPTMQHLLLSTKEGRLKVHDLFSFYLSLLYIQYNSKVGCVIQWRTNWQWDKRSMWGIVCFFYVPESCGGNTAETNNVTYASIKHKKKGTFYTFWENHRLRHPLKVHVGVCTTRWQILKQQQRV